MAIHVTPIPRLTVLTTPAFTLGTANAAGAAITAVASNSTLLAFDATTPAAVAAAGVVGSATVAARRDHVHASVSGAITTVDNNIARYTGTAGALQGYTSGGPTVSDTGVMNLTAQPMVLTTVSSEIANVTGGGTTYTLVFDEEVTDQGGNMTTTTFTAPVDGNYLFNAQVMCVGLTADMNDCRLVVDTANRNYGGRWLNIGVVRDSNNTATPNTSVIADMDASDTATVTIRIAGDADTVDIAGGSDIVTWVSIGLLA